MKKLMLLFFSLVLINIFAQNVLAYDDHGYPYTVYSGCVKTCYPDDYDFCQNNCTSYAAYMLNLYGVPFNNKYKGVHWSHGGKWDNAARAAGIPVDDHPIPGDVAYWNSMYKGDIYGHVAWVEKVYYDSKGKATDIDITEYNYKACSFGHRKIKANNPDGFIHILAYIEGVTGLHYVDCYEMYSLCDYQTLEEWEWILERVNEYRCKNCSGDIDKQAYVDAFFGGFGGGPVYPDGNNPQPIPGPRSDLRPDFG